MKRNKIAENKTSAQTVASIDDLLIEIFLHLPLKPLIQFKSVSKHWNSLISDTKLHDSRNKQPNPAIGLIFRSRHIIPWHTSPSLYAVSFEKPIIRPLFGKSNFTNLSSCNGLILCINKNDLYICNPTTNKYSTLPHIFNADGICLAFDPSRSPHYKIICVMNFGWRPEYLGSYKFEVYSSETGKWRKCDEPFTANVNFRDGVYWNGAIHWISFVGQSIYFNPDDDQVPRVMPTPPIFDWSSLEHNYYFGESCGHLYYIYVSKVGRFDVYEMRRDYSEWFVKFRVDVSDIVRGLFYDICSVVRGKKDEDAFLVLRIRGKFIRYNLVYKTFETICELEGAELEDSPTLRREDSPLQYIESLCSV